MPQLLLGHIIQRCRQQTVNSQSTRDTLSFLYEIPRSKAAKDVHLIFMRPPDFYPHVPEMLVQEFHHQSSFSFPFSTRITTTFCVCRSPIQVANDFHQEGISHSGNEHQFHDRSSFASTARSCSQHQRKTAVETPINWAGDWYNGGELWM